MQDAIVKEFLVESCENLERLDGEFVALEKDPQNAELLSSIFRTFHTVKSTAGFLSFDKLERIAHVTESILSQLRDGKMSLDSDLVTVLHQAVDALNEILGCIEQTAAEGNQDYTPLLAKLAHICVGQSRAQEKQQPPADSSALPAPESRTAAAPPADQPAAAAPVTVEPSQAPSEVAAPSEPPPAGEQAEPGSPGQEESQAPGSQKSSHAADSVIRVQVELLDQLMNLTGELVLSRNQILQYTSTQEDTAFIAASQNLDLITTELQESIMKTRMQPIGSVWKKLPRVVRDLAKNLGKQVKLDLEGEDTELDKTIIEAIKDPLVHIVRNSVDHGIETPEERTSRGKSPEGTIYLRAYHEGGQVKIEISDDGAGISAEKVKAKAVEKGLVDVQQAENLSDKEIYNFLTMAGFSTAERVTNVSGRGVGLDVVRTNIEKIGGTFDLSSEPGKGTSVKIKIPLTLAIIPALVVTAADQRFAIPQVNLLELVRLDGEEVKRDVERIAGTPVYRLRGDLLPLVYLDQILARSNGEQASEEAEQVSIVVLQADNRQFGLVVDSVYDTEEIVVKPLGSLLKGLSCFAGATIMGDGQVALILDVMGIAHEGDVISQHAEQMEDDSEHQGDDRLADRQTLLIFTISGTDRFCVPLSLVDRLEEFPRSKIENVTGHEVIQYRGGILSLVRAEGELGLPAAEQRDEVQVIVFKHGEKSLGIMVDKILDIVDEVVEVESGEKRKGVLGSAIIQDRVVDLLDIYHIIQAHDLGWFNAESVAVAGESREVLLVDDSLFFRKLLRSELEISGYRVSEVGSGEKALERLAENGADLVISELALPDMDGYELVSRIKQDTRLSAIPVLALTNIDAQEASKRALEAGFGACQVKFDREAVLKIVRDMIPPEESR